MAPEAAHHNLFSQQIITSSSQFVTTNSEMVKFDQTSKVYQYNNFVQMGFANPCATSSALNYEYLDYNNVVNRVQTAKDNSNGLTCNVPVFGCQGKRPRESLAHQFNIPPNDNSFLSPTHEMQQQIESDYVKKMKVKSAEKGKEATKLLIDKVTKPLIKYLKEREEKMMNLEKLNLALEEKVKALLVEKQLWKDIANCINEITGMHSNLDNVMAHVTNNPFVAGGPCVVVAQEDAGFRMNTTGANYDHGMLGMVDVGGKLVGQGTVLGSMMAEVGCGGGCGSGGCGHGKERMCKCKQGIRIA